MRLTLRTLLAYLDDRLPPSNAKEIGQKISKSPFAMELTERIRDVVRRRRLAAPEKPVAMIDANLVAEYLDDQLTPELVARIEREILQSDAALAEVAATHEILGLLRDPVALEPRLRDRLYALDPSGRLEVVQVLAGHPTSDHAASSAGTGTEWKPLANRSVKSRRTPLYVLCALALGWVAVLVTDSHLFQRNTPEVVTDSGTKELPTPAADQEAVGQAVDAGDTDVAVADAETQVAVAAVPDAGAAGQTTPDGPDAKMPVAAPVAVTGAAAAAGVAAAAPPAADSSASDAPKPAALEVPPVAVVAGAEPMVTAPVTENPAEDLAEPAKNTKVYPVYLTDEFQMGLLLPEGGQDWKRASEIGGVNVPADQLRLHDWREPLQRQWVGIPEPWQLQVALSGSGWRSILSGGTILQVVNEESSGLRLSEGRVLVSRDAAAAIPDGAPVVFLLKIGEAEMPLTLMTGDTRLGIEAFPEPQSSAAPPRPADEADAEALPAMEWPAQAADYQVRLYVVQGSVQITGKGGEQPTELLKSQAISWRVLESGEISNAALVATTPLTAIPEWVFAAEAEVIPERRDVMAQVATAFAAGDSLRKTALALSSDRNPQVGEAAVSVVSLMRDVESLMTILLQSSEESVRRAAINGLSRMARQTPEGREAVRRALETRLAMNEVVVMLNLIVGLSDQDVREPAICAELLTLLSHDRAAVRELAFYRMEQFTHDRFGYYVDADPGRRKEAVRRWQRHIERNDGRLVP